MLPSKQDDINESGERVCLRLLRMNTYKRHRFPPGIISYAIWIYCRFNPSHRNIEELLAERGIVVSRESIRL
ncbi:MAG: transposase-like protein [Halieaceae bacterium]|jgi:transposase-like protein